MLGILPFLIQWVALSYLSNKLMQNQQQNSLSGYYPVSNNHPAGYSLPPKSHWTLLSEFQNLSEEEIELFLPQICNMALDRESLSDPRIFDYFESIIIGKCAECLPFGMRVCGLLRACSAGPTQGLLKNMLSNTNIAQRKEDELRRFQEKVEFATAHGIPSLPAMVRELRIEYFRDFQFLLDTLARLGLELKSFPVEKRNIHLRRAINQYNALLSYRMVSQRSICNLQSSLQDIYSIHGINADQIAQLCPAAACFSLHLPLQHSKDNVLRILRFVESECEILPSKDRCPYLVVVELLEQPFPCKSDELFTEGRKLQMSKLDLIKNRDGYQNPQIMPTLDSAVQLSRPEEEMRDIEIVSQIKTNAVAGEVVTAPSTESLGKGFENEMSPEYKSHHENVELFARDDIDGGSGDVTISRQIDPPRLYSDSSPRSSNSLDGIRGGGGMESNQNYAYQGVSTSAFDDNYAGRDGGYRQINSNNGYLHGTSYNTHAQAPNQPHGSDPHPYNMMHHNRLVSHGSYNQGNAQYDPQPPYNNPQYPQQFNGPPAVAEDRTVFIPRGIVRPKTWEEKKAIVKSLSPFGQLPGWTLRSFIVKSGDDLRKEMLAMQLIEYCQRIFEAEGLDIYLRPYQILNTGYQSGLIEFLEGSVSIDRIKKLKPDKSMTLREYFELSFGESYNFIYAKAVQNFVKSLVGYSLVTYLASVRDRHNANLLIDPEGHIVHIDFGFIFGDSPGFNLNFESAPFKLTKEYLDIIGGIDSPMFGMFEDLFLRGFLALQRHIDGLAAIVQLFYGDKKKGVVEALKSRLLFPQSHQDILGLIRESLDNWRTKQYDWFQQQSNNIQM